jgi:tetratricopeptide (TPR) repeat protein
VVAEPAPPVPAGPKAEDLLAQATTSVEGEDWDKAVTALDLLLNRPGDPPAPNLKAQATALKKKVDLERRSADLYAAFEEAVKAKEPDVALTRFEGIPTESIYRGRAEPALADMKAQFLAMHLDLAESARAQGRCDDARGELEKVEQVDPENRKAAQLAKGCRPKVAARVAAAPPPPPAPRPPAVRAARVVTRTVAARSQAASSSDEFAPPASETSSATDPAELIKEARTAWMHQQCGQAIELSRKALKAKPGAGEAHQIIAVCSCSLKDRDGALKSYLKLDERSRGMVRNICGKNGVELEE